jgi:hypothetical protein
MKIYHNKSLIPPLTPQKNTLVRYIKEKSHNNKARGLKKDQTGPDETINGQNKKSR